MLGAPIQRLVGHLRRIAADRPAVSDRELLEAFHARRDQAAFETLVRRHGPMVYGVCHRILADRPDADDAFQATFLVLVKKARSIDRPELLANWLYGVACRTAQKARGLRARLRFRERPLTHMHEPLTTDRTADHDLRTLLDEELARLPEKYRVALLLCELQGRSRRQAAETLGLAEGTLSSRLARGRQLLAVRLSRRGIVVSVAALAAALAQVRADAGMSLSLVRATLKGAVAVAAGKAAAIVSAPVIALTEGVLQAMATSKLKTVLVFFGAMALFGAFILTRPEAAEPAVEPAQAEANVVQPGKARSDRAEPRGKSVIILWMSGGPSQMDTFDLKPGNANGGPFKEIATTAKDIKISEHLPNLAKQMQDIALIRSLSHREGDHIRATRLMQTGYSHDANIQYPAIGSVLSKELGGAKSMAPHFVRLIPGPLGWSEPGFLGPRYAPITVASKPDGFRRPDVSALETITMDQADAWAKVLAEAMDLSAEKAALRDSYGNERFGQCCLIARRLVERRVPVIEITLDGWDTHVNNFAIVAKQSAILDAGWSTLITDLRDRKLLDSTLIVWMGEFGRTPRINAQNGRDHWPGSFTVALAGGGIQGGQAIGSTNADGVRVDQRPVTVAEFHATIYTALSIDPAKQNQSNTGKPVRLVDGGAEPIHELLPKNAAPKAKAGERPMGVDAHLERLARMPADLIKAKKTDGDIIEALFTAVLARLPNETEKGTALLHLKGATQREEACRNLVWVLVNTREFFDLHSLNPSPELANRFSETLDKVWKK